MSAWTLGPASMSVMKKTQGPSVNVRWFLQGVVFTMGDFHTFEVFNKNVQKLKIGNNENSDGSDIRQRWVELH